MAAQIHRIRAGVANAYVIREKGTILVDTGTPGNAKTILSGLGDLYINPRTVMLIVLTHGHSDHTGSADALRAATGARIAIQHADRGVTEKGTSHLPDGLTSYGRLFIGLSRFVTMVAPKLMGRPAPLRIDIEFADELDLKPYGVSGRVVRTPGHTPGSSTVLLDSGDAFVGDLAMNGAPFVLRPGLAPIGLDRAQMAQSWRRLVELGAHTIYPGHGKPFAAELIR